MIHSVCSGTNGTPLTMLNTLAPRNVTMKPISAAIWNSMYFLRLSYRPRPIRTALTIVEKSSSVRIIAAASFETSVPVMPMAMPMSARFRAGASLTPSPVIATT